MAKITIQNAKRIQNLFRGLPDSMKEVGQDLIVREFKVAVAEAKGLANDAKYTGSLVNGISLDLVEGKYHYVSKSPHAAFAEFGTLANYTPKPGYEKWASQFKGLKIHSGDESPWKRISFWAWNRGIEKKHWFPIFRKIVLNRQGMKPIVAPFHRGYFIPPYISAKARIEKGLKALLSQAVKRTRK
jgi:hypothetical protein